MSKEPQVDDEVFSGEGVLGKIRRVFIDRTLPTPPSFVYEVQEHNPRTNKYDGTKYLLYPDDLTLAADVDPTP